MTRRSQYPKAICRRGLLYSIAIVAFGIGCVSNDSADRELAWTEHVDSARTITIWRDASTCVDCVKIIRTTILGDTTGPGYIDSGYGVVRDSLGRYWVGNPGVIKLFDRNARYLQDIGRVGQGPLEFQIPYPLHVDADGSVHVFDSGNRRESVIRPDLTLMAESQLPAPVFGASPIPGSHDYVVSSWIPRPGMVGHPLHRLSEGEVALSFGAPTDARELVTPMVARLALDADSDGHVFSAHEFSYDVTVWTQDGRRILGLVGPILNEHDILPGHFNTENPPPARISAIRYEGPDRLWVVRWQLRSDWEDRIFEAVQPDGRIRFEMRNGASLYSLYVGEIDIIDLDNGLLMASSRVAPLLAAFVGPDRMISLEELSDGTPQLAVWEVSLKEEAVR